MEKINVEGTEAITRLTYGILRELDGLEAAPQFIETVSPHGSTTLRQRSSNRPWFGSIPAFGSEGEGVLFSGVMPGSPAEKAGLQGGDRLIEIDGQAVRTLEDFTAILKAHAVGDTLQVVVDRDGEPFTAALTLAVRG